MQKKNPIILVIALSQIITGNGQINLQCQKLRFGIHVSDEFFLLQKKMERKATKQLLYVLGNALSVKVRTCSNLRQYAKNSESHQVLYMCSFKRITEHSYFEK